MTAQISETLHYQGQKYAMCTEPLGYAIRSLKLPGEVTSPHTACWRGYVGRWAVEEDALYLKDITFTIREIINGEVHHRNVQYDEAYPDSPDGVFAHWFTGEVRCPIGKRLKYVHMGYASTHEADLFLEFKSGRLIGRRTVVNGHADDENQTSGYGVAGFTTRLN